MSKDLTSFIVVSGSLFKEKRQMSGVGVAVTRLSDLVHIGVCEQPRYI